MAKSEGGAAELPKPLAKVVLLGGADASRTAKAPAPDETAGRFLQAHECRCCGICCGGLQNEMQSAGTAASWMKKTGIDLAALFGVPQERLQETLSVFGNVKIFGAGQNRTAAKRPEILLLKGVRLGFVFLSEQDGGADGLACEEDFWSDGVFDSVRMLLPQCDHVIVLYRAGLPGMDLPLPELRARCRRLAGAGASVVCGIAPDALMGWEEYAEGLIFYGLGSPNAPGKGALAVSVGFERNGKLTYEARLLEAADGVLRLSESGPLKARINEQNALFASEEAYLAEADRVCVERYETGEDDLPCQEARERKRGVIAGLLRKKEEAGEEEKRLRGLLTGESLRQMTLRALDAKQKAGR